MKDRKKLLLYKTLIPTVPIVFYKILDLFYVIPFYAIVYGHGGLLYGYAYNIFYVFFCSIGIGLVHGISKLIDELDTFGYLNLKEKTFKIAKYLSIALGLCIFLIVFFSASKISHIIIGDISDGSVQEEIVFVIKTISISLLIFPINSILIGYFRGNKLDKIVYKGEVLSKTILFIMVILSSFLAYKVFNLSIKITISITLISIIISEIVMFLFLKYWERKNKNQLKKHEKGVKELKLSFKSIIKKIAIYTTPFIAIELFRNIYNFIDVLTLLKVLVNKLNYSILDAENIVSVFSIWGMHINAIITVIISSLILNIIPNIRASFVQNDKNEFEYKINKIYQKVFFFAIPLICFMSFISKPLWTVFYGKSIYGPVVFQYYIFIALANIFFSTTVAIFKIIKEYKVMFISLFLGLLVKVSLNIPFIVGFNTMGLPSSYGAITATLLAFLISEIICTAFLIKKYKINFENTIKEIMNIILATVVMIILLSAFKYILPFDNIGRLKSILCMFVYSSVGVIIYILLTNKTKTIKALFEYDQTKNNQKK